MQSILVRTLASSSSLPAFFARLALGVVILPHGLQKVLGWFGGYGFAGTLAFFTETMGIPTIFALAAILAESAGAVLLIFGLASRLAAAAIGSTMVVAALSSHVQYGFFMNWFGNQAGEGFEFHILAVALAAVVLIIGGGRYSADRWITKRLASSVRQSRVGAPRMVGAS